MLLLYYGYETLYGSPYFGGFSDDYQFEQIATYVNNRGYDFPWEYNQDLNLRWNNSKGYIWLISLMMKIVEPFGGFHTISARILNIYLMISTGVLTTGFFMKYNFSHRKNSILLSMSTLFPNILFISSHVFRDTLITFLLMYIFFIWDTYFETENNSKTKLLFLCLITLLIAFMLYWIRNQSVIFLLVIVLVSIFVRNSLSIKNFIYYLLLLIIGIIISYVLNINEQILSFYEYYSDYTLGLSDGLSNIIFSAPLFPFGIILRIFYGLISPNPIPIIQTFSMFTNVELFFNVITSYGTIVQIFLLPYLFQNIIRKIDKVFIIFVFFFMGIIITTFTFRHFIMIYPFMFILIFRQYFQASKQRKIDYFILTLFIIIICTVFYLFLA